MMINIDASQLEWLTAVYLSQDKVGLHELQSGHDQHEDNQKRFGLPSRDVSKILVFRTLFGGTGHGFANDPKFGSIGSQSWWDDKITEFYSKYKGLYAWHTDLMQRVINSGGKLEMPTGRVYEFKRGKEGYPRPAVLNYPVQGLAADLMAIARVSIFKKLRQYRPDVLLVNTVHDSILFDTRWNTWDNISRIVEAAELSFKQIPTNFERLFKIPLNVEIKCKIEVGERDWGNMIEYKEYFQL